LKEKYLQNSLHFGFVFFILFWTIFQTVFYSHFWLILFLPLGFWIFFSSFVSYSCFPLFCKGKNNPYFGNTYGSSLAISTPLIICVGFALMISVYREAGAISAGTSAVTSVENAHRCLNSETPGDCRITKNSNDDYVTFYQFTDLDLDLNHLRTFDSCCVVPIFAPHDASVNVTLVYVWVMRCDSVDCMDWDASNATTNLNALNKKGYDWFNKGSLTDWRTRLTEAEKEMHLTSVKDVPIVYWDMGSDEFLQFQLALIPGLIFLWLIPGLCWIGQLLSVLMKWIATT